MGWDPIAVIEELACHDPSLEMGTSAQPVNWQQFWGQNYFVGPSGRRNYFVAEMEKVARYALPFVKNISRMTIK